MCETCRRHRCVMAMYCMQRWRCSRGMKDEMALTSTDTVLVMQCTSGLARRTRSQLSRKLSIGMVAYTTKHLPSGRVATRAVLQG